MRKFTYREAGVDIEKEKKAISVLARELRLRKRYYAGLIEFGEHYLSLCIDSVGSKILVANAMREWDTIGIDCVAMNVNDCVCMGAKPLAFVDYLAMEKVDKQVAEEIGKGLKKGAEQAGVAMLGGELASLPEIINGIDLAGACLGVVEKTKVLTGERIKPGDVIIGLRSSGVHSNGLTLARKVFKENGYEYEDKHTALRRRIGDELLKPTKIYVEEILPILKDFKLSGAAHITGSGVRKLMRLGEVKFELTDLLKAQPIFKVIQELGGISLKEMYQTFNMGMGFCVICRGKDAKDVVAGLKDAKIVGRVARGKGVTLPGLGIKYL